MKTMKLVLVFILAGVFNANASESYEAAMQNALEQMSEAQSIDELKKSANQFERIANVASEEWLPLYYSALSYIRITFMSSEAAEIRDSYLDRAQKSIDKMIEIEDSESEIYALQSMLHTARLVIDPMNRGQKMMVSSGMAIRKALELNPKNPRAQYLLLSNEVGQAQFFGQDVSSFCGRIQELYENWDEINTSPQFYPQWGKTEIQQMVKQCK